MIVAIGGGSQSGKNTLAMFMIDVLRGTRGLKIVRQDFSTVLYDVCHTLYGWGGFLTKTHYRRQPVHLDQVLFKINKTPRQLMEQLREHITPEMQMLATVSENTEGWLKIITDVTEPQEIELLKSVKAFLIRVDRGSPVDKAYDAYWNVIVDNRDTRESLLRVAKDLAERVILPHLNDRM